jgi:2-methylcitrate dehydratase PrpD
MMKCIETPGMGKDSIGWAGLVAMTSILMADNGFTGICPMFDDAPVSAWISSVGETFEMMNLYFKPYAACRWAQPGVDGVLKLVAENNFDHSEIAQITISTFNESAALKMDGPKNTEEAQYNLAFPIAAALIDGEVGPSQVLPPRLFDKEIQDMMGKIRVISEERFQKNFPDKAESEVEILTVSGIKLCSGVMSARWDPHTAFPDDQELEDKFLWLTSPVIGKRQAKGLKELIWKFDQEQNLDNLFELSIHHKDN